MLEQKNCLLNILRRVLKFECHFLFQLISLISKSQRISTYDVFSPATSRSVSKRYRLFSSAEFGLRLTHPILRKVNFYTR